MNGYKVCDNSKFLFEHTDFNNIFFITKNKKNTLKRLSNGKYPVYARSIKGIYLQLLSSRVYWTHGINDFIPSLIVGAHIIGLQHGLPGKSIALKKLNPVKIYKSRIRDVIFPFLNNYYCHEVWSPKEFYDKYIRLVFYPRNIYINRKQIPRIEFQKKIQPSKKILYAPSLRSFRSIIDVIESNGVFSNEFISKAKEKGFSIIIRPHPIDYERLIKSNIEIPISVDTSEDIHDSLSTYSVVISDFSGLLVDCWELGINTFCLCDDLEDINNKKMIFNWFYKKLIQIQIQEAKDIFKDKPFVSG